MITRRFPVLAAPLVLAIWAILADDIPSTAGSSDNAILQASTATQGRTVEEISRTARKSLAVISHFDRDGEADGIGSGFVVSSDGLIATCLHVIDEARPIAVRLADGSRHDVIEVYAWDRKLDLAVIRIDAADLPALAFGDSDALNQGEPIVAMGNPLGLEYSVVNGVVSAKRDFGGVEMIQLAIPIEEGNSGGPLMDMRGRVHGVLNMKSLLSPNLGFALPINLLKPLLEKPNPVPMSRWLRIGSLNPRSWQPLMGARWTQRGGKIQVDGLGKGFGGRALCISENNVPTRPYELTVTVRLDDEAGAAGLAFESDGDQKHYGFYPSGGRLRLTRFDGPTVFSWNILHEVSSKHYRPGEWNRLKVRVESDRILCYVNDHLIVESQDTAMTGGRAGLAKFRNTRASFKDFQLGTQIRESSSSPSPEVAEEISRLIENIDGSRKLELLPDLARNPAASRSILAERARQLDKEAATLRVLADEVHRESVQMELVEELGKPEEKIDLLRAALLVSKLDNPELNVLFYIDQVDQMAKEFAEELAERGDGVATLEALIHYLFQENGFHGSRTDYYNRANSYINNVIDDREGLPITLSVLFMELASRAGINGIAGVSLPGHFIVKEVLKSGEDRLIDVFENGKVLSREEANRIVLGSTGRPIENEDLRAAAKKEIVRRILRNLSGIAMNSETGLTSLRYVDLIVAISPENTWERLDRALLRIRGGERAAGKEDLLWILEKQPEGVDLEQISKLYHSL
ncbi:MAG: trypsin-like peptidase domain-containing protein [Verrucomicrobia bacterium]|nr:trypsin-like peptidase domain-containing protein [Verrucomicrobiota bacterium]